MNFLETLFSPAAKKALVALSASVLGLVGLYTEVNPSLPGAIAGTIVAVLNVGGVFYVTNKEA